MTDLLKVLPGTLTGHTELYRFVPKASGSIREHLAKAYRTHMSLQLLQPTTWDLLPVPTGLSICHTKLYRFVRHIHTHRHTHKHTYTRPVGSLISPKDPCRFVFKV